MSYLIVTNHYPDRDYQISSEHWVKVVAFPINWNASDIKQEIEKNASKIQILNGSQLWRYAMAVPESFPKIKELVIFHSFITDIYQTYCYGERGGELVFDDTALSFKQGKSEIKVTTTEKVFDFGKFPILLTCNRLPERDLKYEEIDYRKGFELFLKIKEEKNKLYDMIGLYAFSRSFEQVHNLYRNSNIPLSFYVTIMETLIGRPKSCGMVHCEKCQNDIPHSKVSLEQHFKAVFKRFGEIRTVRHKTFHEAASFDYWSYFFELLKKGVSIEEDSETRLYQDNKEEAECLIRILLTHEFLSLYRKMNTGVV